MAFTKKFTQDPLRDRCYLLVHSVPKAGKTHMVLDLVKKGHFVILFSFDGGTFEVRQDPATYEGRLAISTPTDLAELREDMAEAKKMISRLFSKNGIPKSKIWVCIDTVTAMQQRLMAEARKINIKNPDARDSRKEFVRDATTEVDYNINLTHMSEIADFCATVEANVVVNALSKEEYNERRKTGRVNPAITGQSGIRFSGDADAILCLEVDREGARKILCDTETGGDRSGHLSREEPADLVAICEKMIGRPSAGNSVATVPTPPAETPGTAIVVANSSNAEGPTGSSAEPS